MARVCSQCQTEWGDELEACPDDGAVLTDPLIGQMLGSYRVLKQLGRGGMGGVYLAEHPVIKSRVAVKVMHEKFASDETIVDRFYNEARAVNVIGHDNVLKILDLSATPEGRPYFIMELLEGESLQALLDEKKSLPLEVAGPMLLQICAALQAAHEKGIVHRDLKPENIFLVTVRGQKNVVKVVDFGIARLTDSKGQSAGQTRTGMVMGTPAYMSPEQGSGATRQIGARSDVYSLGVIMYQLAAGRLPFQGKSFGELLAQHLQKQPLPPSNFNAEIPAGYEALILKALEKRQEDRFQSMEELAQELRALLRELGIAAVEPTLSSPSGRTRRAPAMADTLPMQAMPLADGQTIPEGALFAPPEPQQASRAGTAQAKRATTGPPRTPTHPTRPEPSEARRPIAQEGQPAPGGDGRRGLVAMIGIAIILAIAVTGVVVVRASRATRAAVASEAAQDDPSTPTAAHVPVALTITTDPAGAHISATWQPDGSAQGDSPLTFQAPPQSQLNVAIDLDGYASQVTTLSAGRAAATFPFTLLALRGDARPARRVKSHAEKPAREGNPAGANPDKEALINPFDQTH